MSSAQPAFGAMFRELIELGVVEIDTEPLDAGIERRLKEFWKNTSCPRCGHQSIVTWEKLDRIWCRDCDFKPVYTYGTPFHALRGHVAQYQPDRAAARSGLQNRSHSDSRDGSRGSARLPRRLGTSRPDHRWTDASRRIWPGLFGLQRPRAAAEQPFPRRLVPDRPLTLAGPPR